jgi:hypothetical protein
MSDTLKHTFNINRAATQLVPNPVNRNAYLFAVLLAFVMFGVASVFFQRLPERVPLLLTAPWGEVRLVSRVFVFGAGVVTLGIVALNILLGRLWGGGGSLIPRILSLAASVFAVAMGVGLWGVIQSFFL